MGSDDQAGQRYIVGIGVSEYDDPTLNLAAVPGDVETITEWFATRSRIKHARALEDLVKSPKHSEISEKLRDWLEERAPEDVVVIYLAAHGELEADTAYILGRDSPREKLRGRALDGQTLGGIIGQARPQNILVIVDACVAGKLGTAIQREAEDVADKLNTRDAFKQYAQAVLCSTFARDPAHDGCFAKAFVNVVSHERWTGTTQPWVDMGQLMRGLNDELKALKVPQVAELKVSITGTAELIPNANFNARRWGALITDEELATHFDPSSRGVAAGEAGWYFTGRHKELAHLVKWLKKPDAGGKPYVVTGSPGSGKSALVSRLVALSDSSRRERIPDLDALPRETVPPVDSINAVLWCHNKSTDQIIGDLGNRLGVSARTADELFKALETEPRPLSIVVDALDEAVEGEAPKIATDVIRPLAEKHGAKVIVATRQHPVRAGGETQDLLSDLAVRPRDANCLVLDKAKDREADMHAYVAARLMATAEPDFKTPYRDKPEVADQLANRIVAAAGTSFLVAAVTARSYAKQEEPVDPAAIETLELPSEAGAALAEYIERLENRALAVDILRPLAWSEGSGLPWGPLWAPIASALASKVSGKPVTYGDDSVAEVLDSASDLIVETVENGEPAYRLFHEALAEHLRRDLTPGVAHAAICDAIETNPTAFESAHPYVLAHYPAHLARAEGKFRRLYDLVTDPEWERAKRLRLGDSMRFLRDVDLTVTAAAQQSDGINEFLAGACTVYGRMMAVAPAIVVGVIARAGQLQRAELMANNIEFAIDRCLAYTLLAPSYAADGDLAGAQRSLAEAERAISAIDATHSAMAWSWVAKAAVACGLRDLAMRASENAAETVKDLQGEKLWELDNALLWATITARTAGDEASIASLKEAFRRCERVPGRNQYLQAAAVLGETDVLRELWQTAMRTAGPHVVRKGNLALALADAGMKQELDQLLASFGAGGRPEGEDDSQKRYVWALAIAGKFDEALAQVASISEPEERVRALDRIIAVASDRKEEKVLAEAKKIAKKMTRTTDWRVQSLLSATLFGLNERAEALRLAEEVVRMEIAPTAWNTVAFRRSESWFGTLKRSVKRLFGGAGGAGATRKTERQRLHTDIASLSDTGIVQDIARLIKEGKREEAARRVPEIRVPRLRWEALRRMAESTPDAAKALHFWRDALLEARLVSEVSVRQTVFRSSEKVPAELRRRMLDEVKRINVRWIEAGFVEQYESTRASLRSGEERTRLLEGVMTLKTRKGQLLNLIPAIDLSWWSKRDVKALVDSGSAGKRAFALALMESSPELVSFDVVLGMIPTSLSAFEQYHALKVLTHLVSGLSAKQRSRLLRVLAAERKRHITPGTDREALAREIEHRVAEIEAAEKKNSAQKQA